MLHNLIPMIASQLSSSDIPFTDFADIDNMYKDSFLLKEEDQGKKNWFLATLMNQMFTVGDRLLKYDLPAIIERKRLFLVPDQYYQTIELLFEFEILIVFVLDPHLVSQVTDLRG